MNQDAHAPSPTADFARLFALLTAQRDHYQHLQQLSERQQSVIAQGRTEDLLVVLSERQTLIDKLTTINKDLAPLRGRMSELADAAPDDQRQEVRGIVEEVRQLLASIIDRDDRDRQTLQASKASVREELSRVKTAPAAINAYKANAFRQRAAVTPAGQVSHARFTDSRG